RHAAEAHPPRRGRGRPADRRGHGAGAAAPEAARLGHLGHRRRRARHAGGHEGGAPRGRAGPWRPHRGRDADRGGAQAGGDRGVSRREVQGGGQVRALLELADVTAFYGDFQALFGMTLTVNEGEIVTLIGANGAGKTTTLRVISGILRPAAGTVRFEGEDTSRVPAHRMVERGISHVPEGRQLFPFMSVEENLALGAYTPRTRDKMRTKMEEQFEAF